MDLYFRYYNTDGWTDLQVEFESLSEVREFILKKRPSVHTMVIDDQLLVSRNDLSKYSDGRWLAKAKEGEVVVEVFTLSDEYLC